MIQQKTKDIERLEDQCICTAMIDLCDRVLSQCPLCRRIFKLQSCISLAVFGRNLCSLTGDELRRGNQMIVESNERSLAEYADERDEFKRQKESLVF